MIVPRILIVAGSDSGGGAGIQADIKTVTLLGGFAMTAITALTAQNSLGVHGVHPVPPDFVRAQMAAVLDDFGADAVKLGMLGDAAVIAAVAAELEARASSVPLVLDPVMVAKGGAPLLATDAIAVLKDRLVPRAALVTPNLPEAEALTGTRDPQAAAQALLAMGAQAVLVKGGHGTGDLLEDWLVTGTSAQLFRNPRLETRHSHGTGCTLASAIACGLGAGMTLPLAVARGIAFVQSALRAAPGFGAGHGPLGFRPDMFPGSPSVGASGR